MGKQKKVHKESKTPVVPRQFRLADDCLADLDLIAEHHGAEMGLPLNRSDAVRRAAKLEADRIRRLKGAK